MDKGEFTCPLCRQFANSVLPCKPGRGTEASAWHTPSNKNLATLVKEVEELQDQLTIFPVSTSVRQTFLLIALIRLCLPSPCLHHCECEHVHPHHTPRLDGIRFECVEPDSHVNVHRFTNLTTPSCCVFLRTFYLVDLNFLIFHTLNTLKLTHTGNFGVGWGFFFFNLFCLFFSCILKNILPFRRSLT